jgi:arylsulfatase A-like enzyme
MKTRDLIRMACAGMAAMLLSPLAVADGVPGKKLNVLLILTDDQRFSAMKAAGCTEVITPAMDRLVAEGMYFAQNTCMGGQQAAICVPSRAMLMTGASLYKCNGGIPAKFVTLPQFLRQKGYATFATGKWHNDESSLLRSFEFGKAVFHGGMGDHFKTPVTDVANGKLEARRVVAKFDAEVFADATIDFLKTRPQDKPFFAYLAFKTPHDPRKVPEKYHAMYDAAKITLPPNFLPQHPFDNGEMKIRDEMLASFPRKPAEICEHIAAYYAATTATDDQIGRVLKALSDLGLADNTVVVFAGDNGLAVGQHGLMGKQNLYDHSCRVPMVMRGPGIPKGKRSEALCQLYDVYPTLLGLVGLTPPATVDGKDLGPVISGEKQDVRDATLHAYQDIQRAVRTHDTKLIEYLVKGKRTTQLFDLKKDPWEMKNLADDSAYAGQLKSMRKLLEKLSTEYSAPPLGQNIAKHGGKDKSGKKEKKMPNAEAGE